MKIFIKITRNFQQETVKDELKSRRRIRTDGQQLTPGRGGGDYSSQK